MKVKVKSCPTIVTPRTVAYQASPSMGFSRQEYWSGLPLPSPGDLPDPGIKPRSPALQADALRSEPPGQSKVKLLSCVRLFATPWTAARQAPLSMGILQARILQWVVISLSRGSSNPRIESRSPAVQVDSLPSEPRGKPKNTGVGSLSLIQGIFPTQESNWGLLHCRWILYQLSHQGSPKLYIMD